ncbi:MAG TPA: oligosaccharide flippase family protein [Anaerolineae bacterium]|nr:oligosaccharide flippase family protein [Anaerolineae bacterium]
MINDDHDDLLERSFNSVSWNALSNSIQVVIGFLRMWLLARWLPVEVFGKYGMVMAIIGISGIFANFGMGGAFLNRTTETESEQNAAETHFTLKLLFTIVWAGLLFWLSFNYFEGEKRLMLNVLTITTGGVHLTQTASLILVRRVVHRRLALKNLISVSLSAFVAIILAWRGVTIWALLSTNIVSMIVNVYMLYLWRPVWRPKLRWSWKEMRYFLTFGWQNMIAVTLLKILNNVDDLWTGFYLGDKALGLYSRAYSFATYPRKIVAAPVNAVASGTYAELKYDRKRLSQAFFRTNALLIRAGFIFAGIFALIAPEFIRIFLGTKWMPMLDTFRLMLVFTMLDPIKITVGNLFIGLGQPKRIVSTRSIQFVVLVSGLYLLGKPLNISGVALAADLMIVIGMGLLFMQARNYVDFSMKKLFFVPVLALILGMGVARISLLLPYILGNDWRTLLIKIGIFLPIYGVVLFVFEKESTLRIVKPLWKRMHSYFSDKIVT